MQACEISQNGNYNELLETMREISDLRAKITIVSNIITHLQMSFDPELVSILNVLALRCDLTAEDNGAVLVKKLNGVVARMKKWFPRLATRERDLESLRNNAGKIDRAHFDQWLDTISEVKGYHIKANDITVSRFYMAMAKIIKQAEKQEVNGPGTDR